MNRRCLAVASLILASAVAVSCSRGSSELTGGDKKLIAELGFDEALMQTAKKSGKAFERLMGVDESFDPVPAEGVLLVTKSDGGRTALGELQAAFAGTPYRAYLYLTSFGYGDDYVAIVKSTDPYAYLGIVRTDGVNLDIPHEEVLARYKAWDAKYGLTLVGAGQDWLEAEFKTPPADWMAFAKEVYAFSPDVVDQGAGDVETLAKEMREGNLVYLWWD